MSEEEVAERDIEGRERVQSMYMYKDGKNTAHKEAHSLRHQLIEADLVVVGGGLAGICCSIVAARAGIQVALVQDRPVLGGNASSEVRLWILGATSHMGNNNRWAREGGVLDELLVENVWRNPEGNPVIFDSILLEFVLRESRIQLLLNTAVDEIQTAEDDSIQSANAFCSQNQTRYTLVAPLFVDASGDGILGFLSGAEFRMGAEPKSEFGEAFAPDQWEHTLLGHSLYFYTRDTGKPVHYVPPSFSISDITKIPRYRELRVADYGCRLWWLEYGGDRDTLHESEEIKMELWKVAYGVWNYIKNSGEFPEAENLTLEWMGAIPGKRESRRFEGDLVLTQQDIIEQHRFHDAVSYGGWAIDLHPANGVYSEKPGCEQWHSKGVYQIPFRTMYSRNIPNLFLAGRLISASHIAFGSTRVMGTCAHNGQAVGMAAALCKEMRLRPGDLLRPDLMNLLQQQLLSIGQWIPGIASTDPNDLARRARLSASSTLELGSLPPSDEWTPLETPVALLLPLPQGRVPSFTFALDASEAATVKAELWGSGVEGNTTPDILFASREIALDVGTKKAFLDFDWTLDKQQYAFVMLHPHEKVKVQLSRMQVTGVLTLWQKMNKAVAKTPIQSPPANSGIDSFAFWLPERRPKARNLAVEIQPPLKAFVPANVVNGFARPWCATNAWLPLPDDPLPVLTLEWNSKVTISRVQITFDTDFDHPMESVLMGHPERVMPACVQSFRLCADEKEILCVQENHQTRYSLVLDEALQVMRLDIVLLRHGPAIPAIYEVRCY